MPKWSGALWIAAQVFMYVFSLAYAVAVRVQSTPRTVPIGALLAVAGVAWIALSALRQADRRPLAGLAAQYF